MKSTFPGLTACLFLLIFSIAWADKGSTENSTANRSVAQAASCPEDGPRCFGRACVNGEWKCPQADDFQCPKEGPKCFGRICMNGTWHCPKSDSSACPEAGPKCFGRTCVNGKWHCPGHG